MDMKEQKAVISVFGFLSLLLFASMTLAATVDTKTPSKMTSAPAPVIKAPTVTAPVSTVTPKVKIQTPVKKVKPKSSVPVPSRNTASTSPRPADIPRPSSPTRTVMPKVKIKTQPRLQPDDTVKVLPPPNPPTQPQVQPRVNIEKPVRQLPPMPEAIVRQPGSTAKYPEIPDPPNSLRSVLGKDSTYAPGNAAQPGLIRQAPGAYNSAGIYIPRISPSVTANPAIENSKFNDPRLDNIKEMDEAMNNFKAAEQAKQIQDARGEFGQIGSQPGGRGKMGDIHGEDGFSGYEDQGESDAGNHLDRPADRSRTYGNNGYMKGPPTASGGVDASRKGWVSTDTQEDTSVEIDGVWYKGTRTTTTNSEGESSSGSTLEGTDGSIATITEETNADGGLESYSVTIIEPDGYGGTTTTGHDVGLSFDGTRWLTSSYVNGRLVNGGAHPVRGLKGRSQGEVDQGSGGVDNCNWNPLWGRCMKKQQNVQQRRDEITGQPGKGDADSGPGSPTYVIGPDAVTDYEHGNTQGGGRGFNPIDMKDPPKGGPDDETMDAALGVGGLE